jgi:signal transduction histidine kinase
MQPFQVHLFVSDQESSEVALLKKAFVPLNGTVELCLISNNEQFEKQLLLGFQLSIFIGNSTFISWQECARSIRHQSPQSIFVLISDDETLLSSITQGADLLVRNSETNDLPQIIGSILKRLPSKELNHSIESIQSNEESDANLTQLQEKNVELEKINFELDRFVYSASHDLRSPLTSILGLLNIMREEVSDAGTIHLVSLMEESILKLDNTIRDIVAYSRNNRTSITIEPIGLKLLVEEIMGNLRYLETGDFKIPEQIQIKNEIVFLGDRNRIQIILNNLLANAIRYRHPARKPEIVVEAILKGQFVQITVKDNGIGINDKHIGKIFEMFYRTSDTSAGSGLGLYIVRETIKKLNGSIDVVSQINEGSTFTIVLPLMYQTNLKSELNEVC